MIKSELKKASIVICAFNEERTISQSITSLINQNLPKENFEILVIDDESTDSTPKIVKKIIEKEPDVKIQYLKIRHAGLSVARNTGIMASNYNFVGFIDGDAKADKDWVANMLNKFDDNDISIVGGNVENLNLYDSKFSDLIHKLHFKASLMIGKSKITGTNMFFKKEVFSNNNYFLDTFTARGDESYVVANYFKKNKDKKEAYAKNAIVYNEHPIEIRQWLKQQYIEGRCGYRISRILYQLTLKKIIDSMFRFMTIMFFPILGSCFIFDIDPLIMSLLFLFLAVRLLYRYKYFSYGINNIKNLGFIQTTKGLFLLIIGTVISDFGNIYEIIFGKRKNLLNVSTTKIIEELSTNN